MKLFFKLKSKTKTDLLIWKDSLIDYPYYKSTYSSIDWNTIKNIKNNEFMDEF